MLSIFGIRHHGPGSARSLVTALEDLRPDLILVEGPPDANALIPDVGRDGMIPPVALLLYDPEAPARAVYYPFAEFSPEWQALRFALGAGIPVRFMDLPQAHRLGQEDAPQALPPDRPDPFALAARAAGYSDIERWWERFVEQRRGVPGETFQAVLSLMTALREDPIFEEDALSLRREAAMRQIIRQAREEGAQDIAVVCGAWHAPALANPEAFTGDADLLAGLPESDVAATWVPWTYDRLARRSGYGAGITSPGWYDHLWHTRTQVAEGWMVRAARLMRGADLGVSPAHAIEAARLAEALAALRGHPLPGLPEMSEAIRAVFCFDTDTPMRLIQEKLIISQRMGDVPPETPEVPLARDLAAIQRRTRFKPSAESKIIDLDLRRPLLLARSQLLHRLNLLGIPWGRLQPVRGGKGTFHEIWEVEWLPEFAVKVIEASLWGSTVAGAAASRARALGQAADDLPDLTGLVEAALMADLGEVIPFLMARLQRMAAASSDMNHLMRALPPLAGVLRYGDVRKTETDLVEPVVQEMVTRICIGLPPACLSLDDDAAQQMVDQIGAVDETLDILRGLVDREDWTAALEDLAGEDRVHGLVRGCACQRLFGDPAQEEAVSVWMNRTLSPGTPPEHAAAWLEGFLTGSGQLLIYHPHLWEILDEWVGGIPEAAFTGLLPLLRRTFSTFSAAERRKLGERARTGKTARAAGPAGELDPARAEAALSLVMAILKGEGPA